VTADALSPWTAAAVSAAVRDGSATPLDAAREALRRIEERDVDLGAFQVVRRDAAVREAAALDAKGSALPLAGVPVAIKDNIPVEGEPMRDGSAATEGWPQEADHEVVRRIRAAGGVVVGLTRVPELCVWGATDSVYGVTRNPWDPSRTPGGSSGGSAAAVASGQVPVAHGNDGMGSVRIPAACTGLVGIKPGIGVVPCDLGDTDWYGLSENGALATTVGDAALLLSVMADDASLADLDADLGPLCIAVSTKPPVQGVSVDLEHVRALFQTAGALKAEGHAVERFDPAYPNGAAIAGLARWFAGTWSDAQHLDPALLEPRNRTHAAIGRRIVERGLLSEKPRDDWKQKAAEIFETYDVLMTPVLATPPIEAKRWSDLNWATSMAANVRYAPFAAPWNVASFPAMSVPAGVHPEHGTPMAVQLVAAPGKERLLLSLAARIEALRPWQRVAPSYA